MCLAKINLFIFNFDKNMKQLILRIIIFVFPIVAMVVAVNYWADPANLFHMNYKEIARILHSSNVAFSGDCDDHRLLQKFYVNSCRKAPRILVIGSSRSLTIGRKALQEDSLFNNCSILVQSPSKQDCGTNKG